MYGHEGPYHKTFQVNSPSLFNFICFTIKVLKLSLCVCVYILSKSTKEFVYTFLAENDFF